MRAILFFDQTSWLPDNLLERGDRMTMAASIEARMPFMDHELAAFVSGCRTVAGARVHHQAHPAPGDASGAAAEILERPKIGFRVPVNEWFRAACATI